MNTQKGIAEVVAEQLNLYKEKNGLTNAELQRRLHVGKKKCENMLAGKMNWEDVVRAATVCGIRISVVEYKKS